MKPQCQEKVARAGSFASVARLALGDKPASISFLRQGCAMNDAWACDLAKRLK